MRRYQLTEKAFHAGSLHERGEIVNLRDDERPGPHMRPWSPPEPPKAPVTLSTKTADRVQKLDALANDGGATEPERRAAAAKADSLRAPSSPAAAMQRAVAAAAPNVEAEPKPEPPSPVIPAPAAFLSPGFLVLDTETNGFKDPRMAAAGMIFVTPDLRIQAEFAMLIKPDGWTMGAEAQRVNGLSQERLEAEGMDVLGPVVAFEMAVRLGYVIVAHNAGFDLKVMRGEARRRWLAAGGMDYPYICTMIAARAMVGSGKLETAYEKLTGSSLQGAHDALTDARACLEILREMVKRGLDLRIVGKDVA